MNACWNNISCFSSPIVKSNRSAIAAGVTVGVLVGIMLTVIAVFITVKVLKKRRKTVGGMLSYIFSECLHLNIVQFAHVYFFGSQHSV